MALMNDMQQLCTDLAGRGWAELLLQHGLDIRAGNLEHELSRHLPTIDRSRPGFEEFSTEGTRAIEPGQPGRSLLYHALASADVHPLRQGQPASIPQDYPTMAELDLVENYLYAVARRTLLDFHNPVIAVFAYQYRPKALSHHRRHADLVFSRTGIARVGTETAHYDAVTRSFDPRPSTANGRGFAALPARYGVFIAETRRPTAEDAILRFIPEIDNDMTFLFPAHKLFPGTECLFDDASTPRQLQQLQFFAYHMNEKLRRIHTDAPDNPGVVNLGPAIFDQDKPPFLRDSRNSQDLVHIERVGASFLVQPVPNPLVRLALQGVNNSAQIVRFTVPAEKNVQGRSTRFWTSLELPATENGRAAPEYVNIRQEVVHPTGGIASLRNLNLLLEQQPSANETFDTKVVNGGYEAAHFIDSTCDGSLAGSIQGLSLPSICAYSLVTAVDYFPEVEQVEITEWVERLSNRPVGLGEPRGHFQAGGPEPLSDGRFFRRQTTNRQPNIHLPRPDLPSTPPSPAFPTTEAFHRTATAMVGAAPAGSSFSDVRVWKRSTSWLPDSASDVFAPGWDISLHRRNGQAFYTAYGLGSPFPEDSKLCAALNSFWPAVAPDSARTYGFDPAGNDFLPTSIPLLDAELGYHPAHRRVTTGEVTSAHGWDGDFGPFFEPLHNRLFVNASHPGRADHTRNALDDTVGFSGLEQVDASAMIQRMEALRFCQQAMQNVILPGKPSWLVTVERVPDWLLWRSAVLPRGDNSLRGPGYIYIFVQVDVANMQSAGDPPLRRRFPVLRTAEFHMATDAAFLRIDTEPFGRIR